MRISFRWSSASRDDADTVVVCFGGTTRAAIEAVNAARKKGKKVGLFRPITVWPFPEKELDVLASRVKKIVVAEHNDGQMLREVERAVKGRCGISFIGRIDGTVIMPAEIKKELEG